jgi:hypothetical protein
MTIRPTENQYLKLFLERKLNKNISPANWYRIKQALKFNDVAVDEESLLIVAEIKSRLGNTRLSLIDLINGYFESTKYLQCGVKGSTALKELKTIVGEHCDKSTITRWFSHIPKDKNGLRFSADRTYTPLDLYPVYLRAHAYRAKHGKTSTPYCRSLGT